MVRIWRLCNFLRQTFESPLIEKLSFILPFIVISVDVVLIEHAIRINEHYIIVLTVILFILSIVDIIVVTIELHKNYQKSNLRRILTIKLDDFIIESEEKNVKKIIGDFIKKYPEYRNIRNEVYHLSCKIMETHEEEKIEKIIEQQLKKFFKENKKMNVDQILKEFLRNYPKYKKYRSEIYEKICLLKNNIYN